MNKIDLKDNVLVTKQSIEIISFIYHEGSTMCTFFILVITDIELPLASTIYYGNKTKT